MRLAHRSLAALLVLLFALPAAASGPPPEPDLRDGEVLRYRWSLRGITGAIARIFIPGQGDGALLTGHNDRDHLVSELRFTSPRSREGEYWMYGAEIDPRGGRTLKAWTSQFFRGEAKEKQVDLSEEEVIDLTSAIHLLRESPPRGPRRMRIWSNGKFYPVEIVPRGRRSRRIRGREVGVRTYAVRGVRQEGERFWKGKLDLHLEDAPAATPVEIVIVRRGARVRMELLEAESRPTPP